MIYNNIVERLNQLCKFIIIMVLCVNAERHNIISSFRLCKTYQIYSLRIEGYVDLHGLKTSQILNIHFHQIEGYVDCLYE